MSHDISSIPDVVDDEEVVDRLIYEPSFFSDGRLGPTAFALVTTQQKETYISVLRSKYYSFPDLKIPNPRILGDSFCGKASLLVSDVRSIKIPTLANKLFLDVLSRKSSRMPYHAGIISIIEGVRINSENAHRIPSFLFVQKKLSDMAHYEPINIAVSETV